MEGESEKQVLWPFSKFQILHNLFILEVDKSSYGSMVFLNETTRYANQHVRCGLGGFRCIEDLLKEVDILEGNASFFKKF